MFDSCIKGPTGGNEYPAPDTYCDITPVNPPDWFQFLCVQEANSAYLGRYYFSKDKIISDTAYEIAATGYRTEIYTYQ